MIVLTPAEMKKMDHLTIEAGYPGQLLMEIAGRGVAEHAARMMENGDRIVIFAGKGNNGGDGLVAARYLDMWGYDVRVILMGNSVDLRGSPATNYDICDLREIKIEQYKEQKNIIADSELIIDALLGTGISGEVRGRYRYAIELINRSGRKVLSVDIPSGIDGKDGRILGTAVKADITVTMAFLKTGLCLYPGREYSGEIEVIDLGMPRKIIKQVNYKNYMLTVEEAGQLIPARPVQGHKGTFGKLAVIAGSAEMRGAPVLTGRAALRTGAGIVKLGIPRVIQSTVHSMAPELITTAFRSEGGRMTAEREKILNLANEVDVLTAGPGLGRRGAIKDIVANLLKTCNKPLVLDADALNVLEDLSLLQNCGSPVILTPHPGEMARITGLNIDKINAKRLDIARKFAVENGVYLVLKGAASLTALPDGRVYINSTGNEGMATAGSGDVLTGLISGLIAQGLTAEKAAMLGPYLHGLAGDLAVRKIGSHGLVASDIIDFVPEALKCLQNSS